VELGLVMIVVAYSNPSLSPTRVTGPLNKKEEILVLILRF